MINLYKKIKFKCNLGNSLLNNSYHIDAQIKSKTEINKVPLRTDVINYLLSKIKKENTIYLEIGVRYPEENFNSINSKTKYSIDPGIEYELNPVDFKVTSDVFFEQLNSGIILTKDIKFDVIFIDGLHLAEQVDRDIENALKYLNPNGFIVLHDCNPPTEFHASENYLYRMSPSTVYWNGTTWKAFFKYRKRKDLFTCCIDSDWGIGIISKSINIGNPTKVKNTFFEYKVLNDNRKDSLNLISFIEFKVNFEKC
jgi:hypothetical protein